MHCADEFRRRNPFGGALFHSFLRIGSSRTGGLNVRCASQQTWVLNFRSGFSQRLMSALGQKRTLEYVRAMSALLPKAEMDQHGRDVCFVPKADSCKQQIMSSWLAPHDS